MTQTPSNTNQPQRMAPQNLTELVRLPVPETEKPILEIKDLCFSYGNQEILHHISFPLYPHKVTSIIGPSGCGKSTLLRCLNKIYALYPHQKASGTILYEGKNILDPALDATRLRRKIGMVFQKPTPFPMSVFDNVAYGLRLEGGLSRKELALRVEKALSRAALWDEVKDKLHLSGQALSGGQQQRLCIARALAIEPSILLLDEPTSALDPLATSRIEALIEELRGNYTIAIVTHNLQQAVRLSDYAAFLYMGELVECGHAAPLFTTPTQKRTRDYIAGLFS